MPVWPSFRPRFLLIAAAAGYFAVKNLQRHHDFFAFASESGSTSVRRFLF